MGQWTNAGFEATSEETYKNDLQKLFLAAFGDDFLLDDQLPQGILITRLAELLYNTDMDGIEALSRLNPNTASGVFLDLIGNMRGMPRGQGTPQTATVAITCGASNFTAFTIPQGQIFTLVGSDQTFVAAAGKTISNVNSTLVLEYTDTGNSDAAVGGKMQTQGLAQIQDITITYLSDGAGRETDLEYRKRLREEYPVATNTIEYIQNLILELQFVKAVGCNYNDTAETVDTLPAYSTEWMAAPKPGTDMNLFKDKIGAIIVNNKMPGAPTAGNTSVDVVDIFNTPKTVKFTIPEQVELQIEVQVGTPEATGFIDLSNTPDIIGAIAAYINGLGIGDDVSYSRCMAPLTADTKFDVLSFKIKSKKESDWTVDKGYAIGKRQYASIQEADIVIGV